ncbi:MAG: replication initiator protein [Microvirus sp.]|nr:MAG: replication initiator protein [Microvirus sp.]
MSCYRPLKAFRTPSGVVFQELGRYDILGDIELPCGQCIGCRMRRASDWSLRVMHEASMWEKNCFITLTYGRDSLPKHGSLEHRDFQLFIKRLRKSAKAQQVRFYMCGEYGPLNQRPHYHACIFNEDFREDRLPAGKGASGSPFYESKRLTELWGHGKCSVQDLTRETAGYCARYIMKKVLGPSAKTAYSFVDEDGVITERAPEYAAMSLKPGIGATWFKKFTNDVYNGDYVISKGQKMQTPRYYDRLLKKEDRERKETVDWKRAEKAKTKHADNTDERLRVREQVEMAKVQHYVRSLE